MFFRENFIVGGNGVSQRTITLLKSSLRISTSHLLMLSITCHTRTQRIRMFDSNHIPPDYTENTTEIWIPNCCGIKITVAVKSNTSKLGPIIAKNEFLISSRIVLWS